MTHVNMTSSSGSKKDKDPKKLLDKRKSEDSSNMYKSSMHMKSQPCLSMVSVMDVVETFTGVVEEYMRQEVPKHYECDVLPPDEMEDPLMMDDSPDGRRAKMVELLMVDDEEAEIDFVWQ